MKWKLLLTNPDATQVILAILHLRHHFSLKIPSHKLPNLFHRISNDELNAKMKEPLEKNPLISDLQTFAVGLLDQRRLLVFENKVLQPLGFNRMHQLEVFDVLNALKLTQSDNLYEQKLLQMTNSPINLPENINLSADLEAGLRRKFDQIAIYFPLPTQPYNTIAFSATDDDFFVHLSDPTSFFSFKSQTERGNLLKCVFN